MLAIICTMPENQSDRTFMLELYERFFRLMFFTARKYHLQQDACEEVVQESLVIRPLMIWGESHSISPLIMPEPPTSPIWLMESGRRGRFSPLSSSLRRDIISVKLAERRSCCSSSFRLNTAPWNIGTSRNCSGRAYRSSGSSVRLGMAAGSSAYRSSQRVSWGSRSRCFRIPNTATCLNFLNSASVKRQTESPSKLSTSTRQMSGVRR